MVHAQEKSNLIDVSYGTSEAAPGTRFCNTSYTKDKKNNYYYVTAAHCETGAKWSAAVKSDDILYRKVPVAYVKEHVATILDHEIFPAWSLDGQSVTAHIRVYNLQWETGRNQYRFDVEGTAKYDRERSMYYIRISRKILEAYTEAVGNFDTYRMKSASGSPVEYKGKHMGTVSWVMYNPYNKTIAGELEPYEARLYIAPAKPITTI